MRSTITVRLAVVTAAALLAVTGCTSSTDDPTGSTRPTGPVASKTAPTDGAASPSGTWDPNDMVSEKPGGKTEKPKPASKPTPKKPRPADPELAVLTAGVWAETLVKTGTPPAGFVAVPEGATFACGTMGTGSDAYPTYCPEPATIYWPANWDKGAFTTLFVAGHEQAHHIMAVTDTTPDDPAMVERVADCYAGAWLGAARDEGLLVPAEGDDLDGAIAGVFEYVPTGEPYQSPAQRAVDAHAGVTGGVDACKALPPVTD